MLGLVFGSGFENFVLENSRLIKASTPFGETEFEIGTFENKTVAVLHRHGKDHRFAPHQIPPKGHWSN